MAGPTSPPALSAQAPAGSPFRRAGFPGQDSGRRTTTPRGSPPASRHRVARKRRESWCGCPPLLPALAERGVAQTCPPGPGSPLECAPGAWPPACIPRAAGQPRLRVRAGEVVRLLAWGMARAPAPGFKATTRRLQHICPLQNLDATSPCPVERGKLRWTWKKRSQPGATSYSGQALGKEGC